jgi:cytochrome c556
MPNNLQTAAKITLFGLLLGLSCSLPAQDMDPDAVIKYRQSVMSAQGGHMGAMAQIVRGKVDYPDQLLVHARALNSIAQNIDMLFPEGSDFGETDAKEEIWSNWDKFKQAAERLSTETQAFVKAVESKDQSAINKNFKELGEACKTCHKKFRQEHEH